MDGASAALAVKFAGSVAGAALALIFAPPRTIRGFLRRGFASIVCGMVFAPYARSKLGFHPDNEGLMAAACIASFAGWWVMGTSVRIIQAWQVKKDEP